MIRLVAFAPWLWLVASALTAAGCPSAAPDGHPLDAEVAAAPPPDAAAPEVVPPPDTGSGADTASSPDAASAHPAHGGRPPSGVTLLDPQSVVMPGHLGSGVLGAVGLISGGPATGGSSLVRPMLAGMGPDDRYAPLRLAWDFRSQPPEVFGGLSVSLDAQVCAEDSPDGRTIERYPLVDHVLDLADAFAPLSRGPKVALDTICLRVRTADAPVTLRLELKSSHASSTCGEHGSERGASALIVVPAGQDWRTVCVPVADLADSDPDSPFDPHRAKLLSLVIPYQSVVPPVHNPPSGALDIDEIWLTGPDVLDRSALLALPDDQMLEELLFRAAVRLVRLTSPIPGLEGLVQDRSSFGDLFSIASTAYLLRAFPILVRRGWMDRPEAARRIRAILARHAGCPDSAAASGDITSGYCGHGFIPYHFLGLPAGARKRNADDPGSPERDESGNVVELGSIDAALLMAGVLGVEVWADGESPDEQAIRTLAAQIVTRPDWRGLFDPGQRRIRMSSQPAEAAVIPTSGGTWGWAVPDCADPRLYASSRPDGQVLTVDHFSAEGVLIQLAALVAAPDRRPPTSIFGNFEGPDAWPLLGSSGALFVYQVHETLGLDGAGIGLPNGHTLAENVCRVHADVLAGLGASLALPAAYETADQGYTADGRPETLAAGFPPTSAGGVAPYAWTAGLFCEALHSPLIAGLRRVVAETPAFHPLIGLADVVYPTLPPIPGALRGSGGWVHYAAVGVDVGPSLVGLDRALCRLRGEACRPHLLSESPRVMDALARATGGTTGWVEGEWGQVTPAGPAASCALPPGHCGPLACEVDVADSFPRRPLSGGRAAMLFGAGTALRFPGQTVSGPATLTLEYSLAWPEADAAAVVLEVLAAGQVVATVTGLAPTTSWDQTRTLAVPLASLALARQEVGFRLLVVPRPWGIQVDRWRVDRAP